ncbi:AraC family transcriptional regulator [Streptomyces sp. NPDC029006]|uniref:AraC family transcriptional regulator n=1 Tax=Streptomyces sp. NPDC029006 TaxID=3155467 RepID=UPI0033CE6B52
MRAVEHKTGEDFHIVAHLQGAYRVLCHNSEGLSKGLTCKAGDVCLIPPQRSVYLRLEPIQVGPIEHINITLPLAAFRRHLDENCRGSGPDLHDLTRVAYPDPVITSSAVALVQAREAGACELYAECAAQYLIAHILAPKVSEPRGPLTVTQLKTIHEYIHAHLAARITLEDLALQVSLSRYHFLRLFKQTTGMTPHQYLTQQRMEAAKHWLRTRKHPVGRIGQMCGYATAAHFSRAFRKYVGVSPSDYRGSFEN